MKNLFSLILIFCFSHTLSGQDNMVKLIKAFNERYEAPEGATRVVETIYSTSSFTKETPDTTLLIDGVTYELYADANSVQEIASPTDVEFKTYMDGNLFSTEKTTFSESGLHLNSSKEHGDPAMAAMNEIKVFNYDEEDRVTSVEVNGESKFSISYLEGQLIDAFMMDAGMMQMKTKMKKLGDTMRYELEVEFGEEFASMMQGRPMPKEYTDIIPEGDNYRYLSYKEDSGTGAIELISDFLYDADLNVLEEKSKDILGEAYFYTYEYDDEGKVAKRIDQKDMSELLWVYDDEGKLLHEPEDGTLHSYTYDEKGNKIMKMSVFDDNLESLTLYKISYK